MNDGYEEAHFVKLEQHFQTFTEEFRLRKRCLTNCSKSVKKKVPTDALHFVGSSGRLVSAACPVIKISGSQPHSTIASRSSPNC